MKRHVVRTYKLLSAVTLAFAPACSKPSAPAAEAGITTDTSHGVVATPLPSASAPASAGSATPPEDPKLASLRDDLAAAGRDKALASRARFRPLCDAQGYPLVGNLARKTPTADYAPSEFCSEVRKGGTR